MKILKIIANIGNQTDSARLLQRGNLKLLTKLTNFREFQDAAAPQAPALQRSSRDAARRPLRRGGG